MIATGFTSLTNRLEVGGSAYFAGHTRIESSMDVILDAVMHQNVNIVGNLDVSGDTSLSNVNIVGNLDVSGDTSLSNLLVGPTGVGASAPNAIFICSSFTIFSNDVQLFSLPKQTGEDPPTVGTNQVWVDALGYLRLGNSGVGVISFGGGGIISS